MDAKYLSQLEELAQAAIPGEMTLPAAEVYALVRAYRTAQWVRRDITLALTDHDLERIRNAANQLPTDSRPLWKSNDS